MLSLVSITVKVPLLKANKIDGGPILVCLQTAHMPLVHCDIVVSSVQLFWVLIPALLQKAFTDWVSNPGSFQLFRVLSLLSSCLIQNSHGPLLPHLGLSSTNSKFIYRRFLLSLRSLLQLISLSKFPQAAAYSSCHCFIKALPCFA